MECYAQVAAKSLSHGVEPTLARGYEAVCEEEFNANLRYLLLLARLTHRFPGVFFKLLADNRDVIESFALVATVRWAHEGS